jgi:hypothetical protein
MKREDLGAGKRLPLGSRFCSRSGCRQVASKTLTYIYQDSQAVLMPLATFAEPHSYDLCEIHVQRLSLPQGWRINKIESEGFAPEPSKDDLMAIADAIRNAGQYQAETSNDQVLHNPEIGRRGHLRAVQ